MVRAKKNIDESESISLEKSKVPEMNEAFKAMEYIIPQSLDLTPPFIFRNRGSEARRFNFKIVKRMWPAVFFVGLSEILGGVLVFIYIFIFSYEYDALFGTQRTRVISTIDMYIDLFLASSGVVLTLSTLLDLRRVMWGYILVATVLCVSIFLFAIVKFHYALLVIEKESTKPNEYVEFVFRPSFVIGLFTIFGAVLHFLGNVIVFTYFNFKYIHPVMFRIEFDEEESFFRSFNTAHKSGS